MRVFVVGGGIMGLSAARSLVRDGHEVSLFEQASLPNPLGASADLHRLIRYPYGSARGYARMVRDAYGAWARLWADLGVTLQQETGTLVLGAEGDRWASESRAVLEAQGIVHEPLEARELAERYPMLDPQGVAQAFYCPSGGVLRAREIVAALAAHLRERGVAVQTEARVVALDRDRAQLRFANGETLAADRVLVTAGPWTERLLPELSGQARATRQVLVYLEPPADLAAAWQRAPMLLDIGARAGFYLVPPRVTEDGARLGLKIGDHSFGPGGDPDAEREPGAAEIASILEQARRRLRRLDAYRIASAKTCYYDVAPGERFRFCRIGERAYAFCGSSGHGFKFGALVGEKIADVLSGRAGLEETAAWLAGEVEV
jgi:sarcosine oxidase subunit beta